MDTRISPDLELVTEMLRGERPCDYPFLLEWAIDHDADMTEDTAACVIGCYEACAREGMPAALQNLGALYYEGRFVPQSYPMAESLFQEAAEKGQYQACCNLGYIYLYGRVAEPDPAKAFHCFLQGALLAADGNCYYKLGDMYRHGIYVQKDPEFAFRMYVRAGECEQNYIQEYSSDVCMRLGECFLNGEGTERNLDAAIHFLNAAREGYARRRDGDPFGNVAKNIRYLTHLLADLFRNLDTESKDPASSDGE